jgi:hypothetical protein
MKFVSLLIGFIVTILFTDSCRISEKNQPVKPAMEEITIRKKPGSSFQDTLIVTVPTVVFYQPDSMQLERIRMITDSNIFKGSMHDYFYQQRNAKRFATKTLPDLPVIQCYKARYIKFIKADKSFVMIDLDQVNDAYGLYVFDAIKSPSLLDMTNIESQLPDYFRRN